MKTVYVIAVKHLFDYEGNTLNRWEYVQFCECGYTFLLNPLMVRSTFILLIRLKNGLMKSVMDLSFTEIVKVSMSWSLFVLRALFSETLL